MCCFSRAVERVSNTSIFARRSKGSGQNLVYSMLLAAREDLAMILPLPVPKGTGEDALQFISLEGYPDFFADLQTGFPQRKVLAAGVKKAESKQKLAVVDVGSFEASFVPAVKDFERLDERFRLPRSTWDHLPAYADFGFAVFKLKAGRKKIHPMAFEFPRRDEKHLFFPTVHIHDGKVHATAEFDHVLYAQPSGDADLVLWEESSSPARDFVKVARARGIVAADEHVYRLRVAGRRKNEDIVV
jgi:hypothetical protein